ncbi:TerB family tellurite resistance protein [Mesorhizobium sp. Z1-4]|uniref:TerB family tellurite resistance protein n=1 Tax=Mesorhizobium sp. Z1-4 TaxID=2448478 RepID=UPI001FE0B1AF|nr:TerB family tellurite resistance protein [Mesorhizobium sp. Z1-4]
MRKVADDPALTAELLLLVRMVLADGEAHGRELEALRRIATNSLGIDGGDLDLVLDHLSAFGYEITPVQAISVFRELEMDRRETLARNMAALAKADGELSRHEVRLLARVVEILEIDPQRIVTAQPTDRPQ